MDAFAEAAWTIISLKLIKAMSDDNRTGCWQREQVEQGWQVEKLWPGEEVAMLS